MKLETNWLDYYFKPVIRRKHGNNKGSNSKRDGVNAENIRTIPRGLAITGRSKNAVGMV